MTRKISSVVVSCLVALSVPGLGCGAPGDFDEGEDEEISVGEEALTPGVNGKACTKSPYNCKLRVEGGNAVDNSKGGLWAVHDAPVVDGNGVVIGLNTRDHLRFNYGQTRHMNGTTFVFARSTSMNAAAWFPIDEVYGEQSLRDKVGEVNAKDTGLERMGCYRVKSSHDPVLAVKKVVYDTESSQEEAGDYLSMPRANGVRYANLAFSVPGFGLGAPAVDIFPAKTRFRRIDVPTSSGKPSLAIPLWVKDGQGRYRKQSGSMKFVYGYVNTEPGTKRFGWMALEALTPTDC